MFGMVRALGKMLESNSARQFADFFAKLAANRKVRKERQLRDSADMSTGYNNG